MEQARLPIDIVLLIIESIPKKTPRTIYPPSDVVTKTLVAFTTVCRATSSTASRLLWRHCMYIDSSRRAELFLRYLLSLWPTTIHERGPVHMFLSPFDALSEESSSGRDDYDESSNITPDLGEPQPDTLSIASSASSYWPPSPLDNLATALLVQAIFKNLSTVLRSLIIDMPLRSLYPESDHNGVRKVLRHGFELLVKLEEFVSVRDELFLDTEIDTPQPEVWSTCWPELRRLALYNASLFPDDTWSDLAQLPHLEQAVFTRADPGRWMSDIDIKQVWFNIRASYDQRPLVLTLVDYAECLPDFSKLLTGWNDLDPNNLLRIVTVKLEDKSYEAIKEPLDEEFDPIQASQAWIRQKGVEGTLWEETQLGIEWSGVNSSA